MARVSHCWFLIVFGLLLGCGGDSGHPPTFKVTGTVKYQGKAVEGALVTFVPPTGNHSAVGSTNAKGEFSLSTFGPSDGAIEGPFKVSISKMSAPVTSAPALQPGVIGASELGDSYAPPSSDGSAKGQAPKNLLPAKYASEQSSGLQATISKSGPNNFDFVLE